MRGLVASCFLNILYTHKSPGHLGNAQILIEQLWGRGQGSASKVLVMPTLLVHGPHFEGQGCSIPAVPKPPFQPHCQGHFLAPDLSCFLPVTLAMLATAVCISTDTGAAIYRLASTYEVVQHKITSNKDEYPRGGTFNRPNHFLSQV